jgi:hypothetical protein
MQNETTKKKQEETRSETRLTESGHTIQHQGGHLQKALTTPNKLYCLQEKKK